MSLQVIMSELTPFEAAQAVHRIYEPGYAFPEWVLEKEHWDQHDFKATTAYFRKEHAIEDVVKLLQFREPCNIGMRRLYDLDKMKKQFGYETGAYETHSIENPMPNIAIYCHATVKLPSGAFTKAHVINLIGLAFDSTRQPDFKMYTSTTDIVKAYTRMWELAAIATSKAKLPILKIYNVGGGAFAGKYGTNFVTEIFEPAFKPLIPFFEQHKITVEGYDWTTHTFNGGLIPDVLETDDLTKTMYVNAWDPWSLIGNGNECDNSLDGHWGRISNMAVLGWWATNPHMGAKSVAVISKEKAD